MSGDPSVVAALLAHRANPNDKTRKEQPLAGLAAGFPVLSICAWHRNNEAMRVLLDAKATIPAGNVAPPLVCAATQGDSGSIKTPDIIEQ